MREHWYYLHENGDLIHKRAWPGEDNSPFVKHIWPCDPTDRANAWTIVVESLALGANVDRVRDLANKWGCNLKDFVVFLAHVKSPSDLQQRGAELFLEQIAGVNPNQFYDWLASTPKGEEPNWTTCPETTNA